MGGAGEGPERRSRAGRRGGRPGGAPGEGAAGAAKSPQPGAEAGGGSPSAPEASGANLPAVLAAPTDRWYPVLPLRGLAVYPGIAVPLQIGRPQSLRAIACAVSGDGRLFFSAQRDPQCDEPGGADLHAVGTIAILREVRPEEGGTVRVVAEGLTRARALDFTVSDRETADGGGCLLGRAEALVDDLAEAGIEPEVHTLAQAVLRRFERLATAAGRERVGGEGPLPPPEEPGRMADAIAARALQRPEDRQEVLEAVSVRDRLGRLHRILVRETEVSVVERDVAARVRRQMEKTQREYYLREQMKAIQRELGEAPGAGGGEAAEFRAKLARCPLPPEAQQRAERELDRLDKMPPMAAEAVVVRGYVEWLLALPWSERAEEDLDLARAQRILDEDHHGLERVKERLLEYLALRCLRARAGTGEPAAGGAPTGARGPILCLVGPPGAGKTSVARSIARALGRPFVRISLGGVRDEAEIRGHRRTYVGAMPGRLLHGLRQAGKRNPVILLDEIDKMSADYRGDPAAALLEVLDPEQNTQFSDHYLELPFDLSEVLFIATANSLQPLPRPLYDRLEVIALAGYGEDEKLAIARRYLLPRQLAESALPADALRLTDGALRVIIDRYTREAGVRGLEREIGAICRKVARRVVDTPALRLTVTARSVAGLLGRPRVFRQGAPAQDQVGVATGLGWTESGGDLLPIEVGLLPGRGSLQLTGKLGEVMRESAQAALSLVRARAADFGAPADFYSRCELHVHAPEGAVPKDGPSAGVTLVVALLSAVTGVPVRHDVAMTGEITLRGRVLPVGGIKEKVLAAKRAGIHRVVLPEANRGDWEEVGATALSGLTPVFVERIDDVLEAALVGGCPAPGRGVDLPEALLSPPPAQGGGEPLASVSLTPR